MKRQEAFPHPILAIDPGFEQSAWLLLEHGVPQLFAKEPNDLVLEHVINLTNQSGRRALAIEKIANAGMAGIETLDTAYWVGRFVEAWFRGRENPWRRFRRQDILKHITGNGSGQNADSRVRQSLIDRFGPSREAAIGTKKRPGPLYGISKDVWSALAIAVTAEETWSPRDKKTWT